MAEMDAKKFAAHRAGAHSMEHTYFTSASDAASDAVNAERAYLPFLKATSLPGAGIQIVEVLALVDFLRDQFPEEAATYQIAHTVRTINRLLYSALEAIDALADRKVADIVTLGFTGPNLNPWTAVEDRIAYVKAKADE
jgi:hypothetical protein